MIEIVFFSYLSSVQVFITGYLFYYFFLNKKIEPEQNIFEFGFFGLLLLSFVSIFLNFFISISKTVSDIIFIIPFILFFLFFFNKNIFKKIIIFSVPVALLFTLNISYDTINRPDAGLYHLPYTSIINESKVIVGVNNLHFRFGHTSIIQYLSALYNNHLFLDRGILIPLGLIYCHALGYLIFELFNKKNKELVIIFFTLFSFSIFTMNRYGGFGNDAPAHFLFFYLVCESLKNTDIIYKIKKTALISTFVFLNKVTLLFCFFFPVYFIIKNFKLSNIFNKANIFCLLFLSLFLFKNFLVSGCLVFPAEQTCIKKAFWYDSGSKRGSNAINTRLENEAWTKAWVDQRGSRKDFKNYLSDYGWVDVWSGSHGKLIVKRTIPFLIFIFLIIFAFSIYQFKNENSEKKYKINSLLNRYVFFFICISGSVLWFFKFPVFRYGYSYLASAFGLFLLITLGNFNFFKSQEKFKKIITALVALLLLAIVTKNVMRIYPKLIVQKNDSQSPWPNIYSENKNSQKIDNISLYKNGQFLFYKSKDGTCHYNSGPCTHYFNANDGSLDEINLKTFHGYKIFYFKKNRR
jgi:hypothetical protein